MVIKANFYTEPRELLVYADTHPEVILIQLVERKEVALFDEIVAQIRATTDKPFVMVGVPIIDWCKELMPWNDPAVDRRPDSGTYAEAVLEMLETQMLPMVQAQFADQTSLPTADSELASHRLPIVLGGYSLGALFALWASTRSSSFDAIAAASPSVWIAHWMEYVVEHPVHAKQVYLSLGDKEEHCKNRFMKQVGDNIRSYHELLIKQLGHENTVLVWNEGGHFQDFANRIAQSYAWILNL